MDRLLYFLLLVSLAPGLFAKEYTVKSGDTLSNIIRGFGIQPNFAPGKNVDIIMQSSGLDRQQANNLLVGQVLIIPDELVNNGAENNLEFEFAQEQVFSGPAPEELKIDTANNQDLEIQQLTQEQQQEIRTKNQEVDELIETIDAALAPQANDFIENIDFKNDPSKNTFETQAPPDYIASAPTNYAATIPKLVQHSSPSHIESTQLQDPAPTNHMGSFLEVSPLMSKFKFQTDFDGEKIELRGAKSSGLHLVGKTPFTDKVSGQIEYTYQRIKIESKEEFDFEQEAEDLQNLRMRIQWKWNSRTDFSLYTGMQENFSFFESQDVRYLGNTWSPEAGAILNYRVPVKTKFIEFHLGHGFFPHQRVAEQTVDWGTNNFGGISFAKYLEEGRYLKLSLNHAEWVRKIKEKKYRTEISQVMLTFGLEI